MTERMETVFLDAGGVLIGPDWTRIAALLQELGVEVSPQALEKAEPHARRYLDTAEMVKTTTDAQRARLYFDRVLEGAGRPGEGTDAVWKALAAAHQRENLWQAVPAGVPEALARLRGAGLRLAVVSNANGSVPWVLERVGLAGYFHAVFDSHLEGVEKPDPRLFHIALERTGSRAETTLHVGDLYHIDVTGARAAGLHAALLDPAGLYPDHECVRYESLGALADDLVG